MRYAVTGAHGMLGWHMRCYLHPKADVVVRAAGRPEFQSSGTLRSCIESCDVIFHFAGVNRGTDEEVATGNPELAQKLVDACEEGGSTPHIVFASSTHTDKRSTYGESKRRAGRIFEEWAGLRGAAYSEVILPHVFGEQTRPNYNSAVATFAWQLATGEKSDVNDRGELELIHAQDVCQQMVGLAESHHTGTIRLTGARISVGDVYRRLVDIADKYDRHLIPDVSLDLDLGLFNLYRSYLFPDRYPCLVELHEDHRGRLFEASKSLNAGQCFLSTTKPGATRGEHYHRAKFERFLVVSGTASIQVRRLFDNKIQRFDVSGEHPGYIDMPPLHTHKITNTGQDDLTTLFWSHEIFDPDSSDTFYEPVDTDHAS